MIAYDTAKKNFRGLYGFEGGFSRVDQTDM
jgi:hypothetical protein